MIYTPGLRKASEDASLIDKISNFVESIQLDSKRGNSSMWKDSPDYRRQSQSSGEPSLSQRTGYRRQSVGEPSSSHRAAPQMPPRDPDRVTNQLLVQAERFKAQVEAPKGRSNFDQLLLPYDYERLRSKFVKPEGLAPLDSEILFLRNFDQDDEFFHVTSQIDPSLRQKIERGEYVDLERLLPKDRSNRMAGGADDLNKQLYQLITQGTNNFLEPPLPKVNGKINSIRKWDQAFRVFAAIYTHANPARVSEIWQYIYVIHTAAASNPWESVYYYDVNFRELMASKPWRSWGKTYTQGWNMAFNNSNNTSTSNNWNGYTSSGPTKQSSSRNWKDDCCWRFNKNRCKKSGNECNFDHRCTYCACWNHGFHNCRKRLGKQQRRSQNGGANNSSTSQTSPKN